MNCRHMRVCLFLYLAKAGKDSVQPSSFKPPNRSIWTALQVLLNENHLQHHHHHQFPRYCFSFTTKGIHLHKELKQILLGRPPTKKTFDVQIVIIMCIWDGLFSFFLKSAQHSDTFADRLHHKHGRKARWRVCLRPTLCFTHAFCNGTTKMQHPPGSLDGDVCRCLCCKSLRSTGKILQSRRQTSSAHFCKLTSHLQPHSSSHLPLRGVSAFLHLSSHALPGSASPLLLMLTDCPSLDRALASFDALLLESRVDCCEKILKVTSFKCHYTGQRVSGRRQRRQPTETWVTEALPVKWKVK